ncbi:MAG: hypothetical protein JW908_01220 [Anaerolineales bacterium]|nr:hypothetical protein [Anaerolineales bacterium]
MSAPEIWIIFPGIISVFLIVFQRWRRIGSVIGSILTIALALLAWIAPISEKFKLLFWNIEISDTFYVLGRRLILTSNDRPILIIIYLATAFWIIGSAVFQKERIFTPLCLDVSVLLVAALAIDPFLYAAVILEMVVLVSIPLLITPGNQRNRGVVRLLTFQTLAMPFILFTGWLLAGVEVNPEDSALVPQAAIFMAIGFGLLFSIFPFHSWIPLIAEESHPIPASFVFFIFPMVIGLFGINFAERFSWLYTTSWLYVYLRLSGVLMVILGSVWAIFQNNLARLMGFAVVSEIGLSLLTLSLGLGEIQNRPLLGTYFTILLPRALSYGLWAISLAIIQNDRKSLEYQKIRGAGYQYPIAVTGLSIAVLSLIGFPLTAGFSSSTSLWQYLSQQFSLAAKISVLGSIGLIIGYLRGLSALLERSEEMNWKVQENVGERILLIVASVSLIILGIFPQLYTTQLLNMGLTFLNLVP